MWNYLDGWNEYYELWLNTELIFKPVEKSHWVFVKGTSQFITQCKALYLRRWPAPGPRDLSRFCNHLLPAPAGRLNSWLAADRAWRWGCGAGGHWARKESVQQSLLSSFGCSSSLRRTDRLLGPQEDFQVLELGRALRDTVRDEFRRPDLTLQH